MCGGGGAGRSGAGRASPGGAPTPTYVARASRPRTPLAPLVPAARSSGRKMLFPAPRRASSDHSIRRRPGFGAVDAPARSSSGASHAADARLGGAHAIAPPRPLAPLSRAPRHASHLHTPAKRPLCPHHDRVVGRCSSPRHEEHLLTTRADADQGSSRATPLDARREGRPRPPPRPRPLAPAPRHRDLRAPTTPSRAPRAPRAPLAPLSRAPRHASHLHTPTPRPSRPPHATVTFAPPRRPHVHHAPLAPTPRHRAPRAPHAPAPRSSGRKMLFTAPRRASSDHSSRRRRAGARRRPRRCRAGASAE
ncbi:hypothetical protein FB463_002274 [Frigoribacterium faeni]|uniref:Uncharacterized protein n=1 Tax=Frigoribacterium faeni TaxID=145483 RepID=A0A7W3JJL4_9MICO|nr:hypothetical protein [Frigoribacterium faeni]